MDTTPTVGVSTTPTCTPPDCKSKGQVSASLSVVIMVLALLAALLILMSRRNSS